jgi:hypothetical protein
LILITLNLRHSNGIYGFGSGWNKLLNIGSMTNSNIKSINVLMDLFIIALYTGNDHLHENFATDIFFLILKMGWKK